MNILVLCTGNSCRSQLLHGFLKQYKELNVYSAGIETHGLNAKAVRVMSEIDIDISAHVSNNVDEYKDIPFDYLITVCDHASENCPIFPQKVTRIHNSFKDPAKAIGTSDEILDEFRAVRDEIKIFSDQFYTKLAIK